MEQIHIKKVFPNGVCAITDVGSDGRFFYEEIQNELRAKCIVIVWNAYDKDQQTIKELVEACETAQELICGCLNSGEEVKRTSEAYKILNQAIAKAKNET